MPGGYGPFAPHFHAYWAAGPALFALLMPFLLALLTAALWRGGRRMAPPRTRPPQPGPRPRPLTPLIPPGAAPAAVLASDLEREQTTTRISHAVGEGRLSIEEGNQRIGAALGSRYRHELIRLLADLPPQLPAAVEPRRAPLRALLVGGAAATVLAAVVVQAVTGLWALWPLAVVVLATAALVPRRR